MAKMGVRRGKLLKPVDFKGKNTAPYRILKHFDFPREIGGKRREVAENGGISGFFVKPVDFIGKSGQKLGSRSFPLNPLIFLGKPVNLGVGDPLLFFSAKRREREREKIYVSA